MLAALQADFTGDVATQITVADIEAWSALQLTDAIQGLFLNSLAQLTTVCDSPLLNLWEPHVQLVASPTGDVTVTMTPVFLNPFLDVQPGQN